MKEYYDKLYNKSKKQFMYKLIRKIENEEKLCVVTANPEIFMIADRMKNMRNVLLDSKTEIVADGIGIVIGGNKLGYSISERIPGVEISGELLAYANQCKKRVFLFGAKPEVLSRLVRKMEEIYPHLILCGYENGYVSDKDAVFRKMQKESPDIILVALGAPHQELLIHKHLDEFEKGIFIGVGGSFDVLSGSKKRAPKFFVRCNLEWLYRIATEPKRLKRFWNNNMKFLFMLNKERRAKENNMNYIFGKIKEKGIRKSIRMFSVKLKKTENFEKSRLSKEKKEKIAKILSRDFDALIIFENHFGYYNIMLQRPQHITRELSDSRTLVLYNSYYDIDYKNHNRITKVRENCYILDMYYYRKKIFQVLRGNNQKKILMVYSTDTVPVSRIQDYQREGFYILYEYVDDMNPDLISTEKLKEIEKRHEYLIKDTHTKIVTTASKLYENVLQKYNNADVALISNGVECDKFPTDADTLDEEYKTWLKKDSIKVGYYGAMANWVDYELLKEMLEDSHIQLLLIGVEHDESLNRSGILEYENVKYFGKKPYAKLAGYAHYFDVCIIPFLINDITKSTSPVKLFEYMSMGKPVVTTALPECKKYDVINVADNAEEFKKMIYLAAEKKDDKVYIARLRECAKNNDWSVKAKEVKNFVLGEKTDEGQAE